jgi:NADH:ubiquinone oxidoreductase subunit E
MALENVQKCCECSCGNGCNQDDENLIKVKEIIHAHKEVQGALIPVLHEVQHLYGYLPEDVLKVVSEELEIPMSEIYGVATFYSIFSLKPKGKYIVRVCMGTACYVKGAQLLLDKLSEELEVAVGATTEDLKYTLEATRCIGACGLAPAIMVNDKVYGRLVPNDIKKILEEYK